ncbi:MAG: hypothetical protein AUI64_05965 [Acidobacteria bacterium 13_1_40CM_2_64_6]|nr:MAG: hypothetical protein AUI64_05965 [Acidobacteria bacterium 13_1_40CM_2_64_6]
MIETVGGVVSEEVLLTFTVTPALVVLLPAASLATAVRIWFPLESALVFIEYLYGAALTRAPVLALSTLNCTWATAMLSAAFADIVTVPESVALAAGEVIETVGGVVSAVEFPPLAVTNPEHPVRPRLNVQTSRRAHE